MVQIYAEGSNGSNYIGYLKGAQTIKLLTELMSDCDVIYVRLMENGREEEFALEKRKKEWYLCCKGEGMEPEEYKLNEFVEFVNFFERHKDFMKEDFEED